MNYKFIQTEIKEHVFTLTLDREAKRNAFTPTTVNEVAHALEQAEANDQVHVLVLRANGPVFCAGMDLKTYQNPELDSPNPAIVNMERSLGEIFDQFSKPSIAIVEGDVIAGGFLYILGCTYVFAKKELNFRLPEIALGIFPFQVMAGLKRIMSEKQILQLCFDPSPFQTYKAIELGLVDGYLEQDKIDDLIASFADKSIYAMQAGMKALKAIRDMESDKQYAFLLESLQNLRDRDEVKKFMAERLNKN
ncbi:enoyl-CoA hydratase/isomerase family protein [Sphingobacterium mizutaii]|uniref:enoyl-CoA hydratase/isomerase family protein n=1 Tax=Sphingobacterium mizutaii TaxID=1010 RepID=UPI0016272E12|nr:enoyl-CoA hydratase/isomerase family protein [Sphingobacterium mizutaii]